MAVLPQAPVQRVVFFGTPEMAVSVLAALVAAGLDIALVVTRHDKKRGRGGALVPSPVKQAALDLGLLVTHDVGDVLREHARQPIQLGIVVAFGALIKLPILQVIPMVNLHVSLLPRWRGAAPIERAIMAGDEITGVCLMQLEEGLDTGGIIDQRQMPITPETTVAQIKTQLMAEGIEMLVEHLQSGTFNAHPQQGETIYAPKIEAAERHIVWHRTAPEISRLIRIGGAWTFFRGKRLKVHSASVDVDGDSVGAAGVLFVERDAVRVMCGEGRLILQTVQAEGRPLVSATDWARGARLQVGEGFDHD